MACQSKKTEKDRIIEPLLIPGDDAITLAQKQWSQNRQRKKNVPAEQKTRRTPSTIYSRAAVKSTTVVRAVVYRPVQLKNQARAGTYPWHLQPKNTKGVRKQKHNINQKESCPSHLKGQVAADTQRQTPRAATSSGPRHGLRLSVSATTNRSTN